MSWSKGQQQRLQTERQILKKYFPNFSWINPTNSDNTRVEGSVHTNAGITTSYEFMYLLIIPTLDLIWS
jgi:hypothetical protein